MPVALISTITSPALGPSSCTVAIDRGSPALWATAARTSMVASQLSELPQVKLSDCTGGDKGLWGGAMARLRVPGRDRPPGQRVRAPVYVVDRYSTCSLF